MADTTVTAELAGRVISTLKVGIEVDIGEDVVLIESMKMEIPVASPARGKVKSVLIQIDDMVEEGQPLLVLET
jgi:biotin carboxyl carrier protein